MRQLLSVPKHPPLHLYTAADGSRASCKQCAPHCATLCASPTTRLASDYFRTTTAQGINVAYRRFVTANCTASWLEASHAFGKAPSPPGEQVPGSDDTIDRRNKTPSLGVVCSGVPANCADISPSGGQAEGRFAQAEPAQQTNVSRGSTKRTP